MKTKPKSKATLPYRIEITWSAADQAYAATVPALRYCLAYGDTPERAAKEVRIAAQLWLQSARKLGKPIPAADATLQRVCSLAPLLNVSSLAKASGMSVQTLASKLKRGTAFTAEEAARIGSVLHAHGVTA